MLGGSSEFSVLSVEMEFGDADCFARCQILSEMTFLHG